jgi:hypothetical protein
MTKILVALLSLIVLSSSAFAANTDDNCKQAAINIAKMNLDSKAQAYGFTASDIEASSVQLVHQDNEGALLYDMNGSIYKGSYDVQVGLDSSCGVESVKIQDMSAL